MGLIKVTKSVSIWYDHKSHGQTSPPFWVDEATEKELVDDSGLCERVVSETLTPPEPEPTPKPEPKPAATPAPEPEPEPKPEPKPVVKKTRTKAKKKVRKK